MDQFGVCLQTQEKLPLSGVDKKWTSPMEHSLKKCIGAIGVAGNLF